MINYNYLLKGQMKKKDFYKFYKMLRGTDYNLQKITDYVFSCKFFFPVLSKKKFRFLIKG